MDFVTHLLVGRLLATFAGAGSAPLAALATLFAVLPDADTLTWFVPRLRRYVRHRGATHSLLFGALASLLAAGLFALANWAPFALAFAVAFGAFLSHVLLDVLNWGCLLWWPFRPRARVEYTVHAGFAWSAGLSLVGLAALEGVRAFAPALALPAAAAMAGLFAGYLGLRLALRLRAARRAPGRRLLPTGNPFVWLAVGEPDEAPAAPAA